MALSNVDRHILRELQRDGLMPNAALGEVVHLSESAAARHRHRLEREGHIKRYAAVLDPARLGYGQTAFVEVSLEEQNQDAQAAFEAAIREVEEVLACYRIAGEVDYLLCVIARDAHEYERTRHCLGRLPHVARLHTRLVLDDVLVREGVPVP